MSRLVKKSPSVCTDLPLDQTETRNKLHFLAELLRSCYGPTGRLKQIHNNIGGPVVTTSTSSVLLSAISSSQPLIRLIIASIRNHVSRFSDCGLFAAILCLSLIEQATKSGIRRNVAMGVNKHLLGLSITYLQQEACGCRVQLDFSNTNNLITLARSLLSSKPAVLLTDHEVLHLSKLAVRAFLLSVPCSSVGTVTLGKIVPVCVEGHPVLDSAVFPGLLVDMPDNLAITQVEHLTSGTLRVLVFSVSLAGDLSEVGDGTIEVHHGADTDSQILEQLLQVGQQAVKDEVMLFMCQKVIHPVLQHYLRSHGVVVVERLGISLMQPLEQLTGAQPVATLHTTTPAKAYGKVRGLSWRRFGSKTMLHLCAAEESAICTMILCHRNETMLNELKVVCQKTEHVLRLTLREPSALLGAGCTETHLAAYIRHQSMIDITKTASALGCSQAEYQLGVQAFCSSLESVAAALERDSGASFMDLSGAHHWTLPADALPEHMQENMGLCGCGLMESSPSERWSHLNTRYPEFQPASLSRDASRPVRVLDSFTAKLNALQVAVETANIVLDVRYIIEDVN